MFYSPIFTIFSCLLGSHLSEGGLALADHKRFDINTILLHKEPLNILNINDQHFDKKQVLEDNFLTNNNVQKILNKLSDTIKDSAELSFEEEHSSALFKNGKSETDSDSSEENKEFNIGNTGDVTHILGYIARNGKEGSSEKAGSEHKGIIYESKGDSQKVKDGNRDSDNEQKLKEDADVFKNNITLRSSCNKGAAKACKRACKGVLKNVCYEFRCTRGMKNRFKLECKNNCRKKFNL